MTVELTPHQEQLLAVLKQEARANRVAPNDTVLADMAGFSFPSSVKTALLALVRKDQIHIEGTGAARVIVIIETGECTARPQLRKSSSQSPVQASIEYGAAPCWRCGSRPDACMCSGDAK